MGNINDYGLKQIKRLLLVVDNSKDATYLECLRQAVDEINSKLDSALIVTVTGSDYALTPAPAATSLIWNALAWAAIVILRREELRVFLDQMEGLSTLRDDVMAMGRTATIRAKQDLLKDINRQAKAAIRSYQRSTTGGTVSMEEIGLRETDSEETDA